MLRRGLCPGGDCVQEGTVPGKHGREEMQMKKIIHRRGFKALEGGLEPQALRRHTGKIAGGGLRLFVRISVIKDRKPA